MNAFGEQGHLSKYQVLSILVGPGWYSGLWSAINFDKQPISMATCQRWVFWDPEHSDYLQYWQWCGPDLHCGNCYIALPSQQRGFPMRKYFTPGFERSSGASADGVWESGNLRCVSLIHRAWNKTKVSNGLGHNKSKVSGARAETERFHTNFSRSRQPLMSKDDESGWWG